MRAVNASHVPVCIGLPGAMKCQPMRQHGSMRGGLRAVIADDEPGSPRRATTGVGAGGTCPYVRPRNFLNTLLMMEKHGPRDPTCLYGPIPGRTAWGDAALFTERRVRWSRA